MVHPSNINWSWVYKSTCTFGSKYVGRSEKRVSKHHPKDQHLKTSKLFTSLSARHPKYSWHKMCISRTFKTINNQPTSILLYVLEPNAIKCFISDLCLQKGSALSLSLTNNLYDLLTSIPFNFSRLPNIIDTHVLIWL